MWSLFLVGHLYLSGIWQGLQLITDTCDNKIGQRAHNIDIILSLISNMTRSIYVIIRRVRESLLWTLITFVSLFQLGNLE